MRRSRGHGGLGSALKVARTCVAPYWALLAALAESKASRVLGGAHASPTSGEAKKATYLHVGGRDYGKVSENSAFLTWMCISAATPCRKRH